MPTDQVQRCQGSVCLQEDLKLHNVEHDKTKPELFLGQLIKIRNYTR